MSCCGTEIVIVSLQLMSTLYRSLWPELMIWDIACMQRWYLCKSFHTLNSSCAIGFDCQAMAGSLGKFSNRRKFPSVFRTWQKHSERFGLCLAGSQKCLEVSEVMGDAKMHVVNHPFIHGRKHSKQNNFNNNWNKWEKETFVTFETSEYWTHNLKY